MTTRNATYDQGLFRGRNDDGNLTTATWIAAENTNFSVLRDTIFRLRFRVDQTLSNANANLQPNLAIRWAQGGAYSIPGAQGNTAVKISYANGANLADNTAITVANFLMTAGSGTAIDGVYDENGGASGFLTFASGVLGYTEVEHCLILNSASMSAGETLTVRLYTTAGVAINAYTSTPTITATVPPKSFPWKRRSFQHMLIR